MNIRGSVDTVTTKQATGWVYVPGRPEGITVHAVLNHEIVGDTTASEHRADLAAAGLGDGNCGFTVRFYRDINPLYLPFVSLKIDGGDAELPRSPQAGFIDFFSELYRAHPLAGRPRSVFGGLWTDRSDAAAVLKGKMDIGQVPGSTATALFQLIHSGITILAPSLPGGANKAKAKRNISDLNPDQIGCLVEEPSTLTALQAIFEDHPFVFRAEGLCDRETELTQPSAESELSSPAECLAVIAALGDEETAIDVVRDSHLLPEFTQSGASRWINTDAHLGVEIAALQQARMACYVLPPGTSAIVGPGTIYRVRCANSKAAKLLCAPSRLVPISSGR